LARSIGSEDRLVFFVPAYTAFAAAGNNTPYTAAQAVADSIVVNRNAALKTGFPLGREKNADRVRERTERAIELDRDVLGDRSSKFLANRPLWPDGELAWTRNAWGWVADALQNADRNWSVWTDWYEDRLLGKRINPALERDFAIVSDEFWSHSISEVNKLLTQMRPSRQLGLTFDATAQDLKDDQPLLRDVPAPVPDPVEFSDEAPPVVAIPEPEPRAIQFSHSLDGPIDLAEASGGEILSGDAPRREDYLELRRKGIELRGLGHNRLGIIDGPISRFLELSENPEEVRAKLFWSRVHTLRIHLASHEDAIAKQRHDGDERQLEPMTAFLLKDFVETANIFMVGEPLLLELDAVRPGPQESLLAREEISDLEMVVSDLATETNIVTKEAQEVLQEQVDGVRLASDGLFGRQAAEFGRKSLRNFVSELFRRTSARVNGVLKSTKTELGLAGKLAKEGAYRAAGPAFGISVISEATGATNVHADFFRFIAHHADALSAYVMKAFQNPALLEIINWISRVIG
jgi:hypothetical protein